MNVSNELKASCKYMKFDAKTLRAISVKNIIKKTLSIWDKNTSLTTEDPSAVNSALVSQNRVKKV